MNELDEAKAECARLEALVVTFKEWAEKFQAQRDEALDQRDQAMAFAERFKGERYAAWERGYRQGYSDREKTDHDRADVFKSPNPYPAEIVVFDPPAAAYITTDLVSATLVGSIDFTLQTKFDLPDAEGTSLRFCACCQPFNERDGEVMKPCEWREDTGMQPAWLCGDCYADWKARPE